MTLKRIVESEESRSRRERSESIEAPLDPFSQQPDLRSPLERFRTKPRKPLSVTDLISPSWCELQYWYVLTKHGKKKRTPAMRQGSRVHKILEDQVHTTVPVDLVTKVDALGNLTWNAEDAWGLRMWNIIQGLRTLRETGMTRELEVWGVVDGLVVNGVIDQLSYTCPDRELEEEEANETTAGSRPAADQASITEFLRPVGTLEANGNSILRSSRPLNQEKVDKVYLTDVKTRGVKSVPKGASFRPTIMQLMIYHRLLSDLVTDKVNADTLFDRYDLNANTPFSDSLIAQIGNLNAALDESSRESPDNSQETLPSTQDSMAQLIEHNSLRSLWTMMIEEFADTLPHGMRSIGKVLKAEYRDPTTNEVVGTRTFLFSKETLNKYLADEMQWWRGERAPQGVCIEEAYKCSYCEFAEDCSWRKKKIEDAAQRMRERRRSAI